MIIEAAATTQRHRNRRRQKRIAQGGISLIEIMVVLVVLLIGVFTVIRIFPIGLGTLRATENRTIASHLAQQLLEQVKADQDSLPLGVTFKVIDSDTTSATYGQLITETGEAADPHDLKPYTPLPNSPYFTDVNKFRFIEGEPVKVPLPTVSPLPTAGKFESGSLYTLKFGPIYLDPAVGDPEAGTPTNATQQALFDNFLKVYGAPMTGIAVESGGGSNPDSFRGYLRNTQTYLIDYGDDGGKAYILFTPSAKKRTFFVSYSYAAKNATSGEDESSSSVDKAAVEVAAGEFIWKEIPLPSGGTAEDILERSETVTRAFTRLPASATSTWDASDPYEYKLLSGNISPAAGKTSYANVGVLAFNPAGANYSETTSYGQQAFRAFVDYAVLDWHILRDDREVPSVFADNDGAIPIKLSLNFLKRSGDAEADNSLYSGLYRDASVPVDLQVFDLQGSVERDPAVNPGLGDPLRGGDYAVRNANDDYWVNYDERGGTYRNGTIYLNSARIKPGTQLRILYKADGDWAVSFQKALTAYEQEVNSGAYEARPSKGKPASFGREGMKLWFHRSELDKSVVVTLQYTNITGSTVRTAPVQLTIDQLDPAEKDFAYVDLGPQTPLNRLMPGLKSGITPEQAWRVVGAANGVSLKTRVIWHDNNSTSNAWRIQDVDTYITRPNG